MFNATLPIARFYSEIVQTVADNDVTIVTAETGAGKSTQLVQYLLAEGYKVVATQPRRLAARTVAARVADEWGCRLGTVVGYRTAFDRSDSRETECLFVTDGLAMAHELQNSRKGTVLVIDEVHEWNLNIEVMVAWARHQLELGAPFKVVLMSATLEAGRLSEYFGGAPVISVPGRVFPVEERPAGKSLEDDVADLLRQGRNVLVFQPGKKEIADTVELLEALGLNAEILPLHGDLSPEEQARCFKSYGRPLCVVSTNVAQTSVTIDGIDAVVDSGMGRRIELEDGIGGLYLKPISKADSAQRKGRGGRTKPGVYIDHCPEPWDDRPDFPVAEILRTRLDQTVLRLAEAGIDMEELNFFHQPDPAEIHAARQTLSLLGCMAADGTVTRTGRLVAKLPISVQYARMIIEANRLGVVDDVVTIAAILEQGGITARVCSNCKEGGRRNCVCWQKLVPNERVSDVLAQLAVYHAAEGMDRGTMMASGIFAKAVFEARKLRKNLVSSLKGKVTFGGSGKWDDILRAICAGMVEHVYVGEYGCYVNGDGFARRLDKQSVVSDSGLLVGRPWDLQVKTRFGPDVRHLITMATSVDMLMLADVAPHLFHIKEDIQPRFDTDKRVVVATQEVYFNGMLLRRCEVPAPEHPEAQRLEEVAVAEQQRQQEIERQWREASELQQQAYDLYAGCYNTGELSLETLSNVSRYMRMPLGSTTAALQSWLVSARKAVSLAQAELSATTADQDRQYAEHLTEAKRLRDDANDMLFDSSELLSEALYDQLADLVLDDEAFPATVFLLQEWITTAMSVIGEAQQFLQQWQSESVDTSALRTRFARS